MTDTRKRLYLTGVRFDISEKCILESGRCAAGSSTLSSYLRESGILRAEQLVLNKNSQTLPDPQWEFLTRIQGELRLAMSSLKEIDDFIETHKNEVDFPCSLLEIISRLSPTQSSISALLAYDH